jgi:hypothetical protein
MIMQPVEVPVMQILHVCKPIGILAERICLVAFGRKFDDVSGKILQ